MNDKAIQVVSQALQALVSAALDVPAEKVFIGSLDRDDAKNGQAVIFLYRVTVNADLRNEPHRVVADDGSTVVHEGALPLDLHYLLTTGLSSEGTDVDALERLGTAMQALNDTPDLVGIVMRGETARVTLDPVGTEEMNRIWTLFPTVNYRTSVAYLVSPVWIDPAVPREPAGPVVQEPHRFGHAEAGAI